MKILLFIFLIFIGSPLFSQNINTNYFPKDSLRVEYHYSNESFTGSLYKNINSLELYTGWVCWVVKNHFSVFYVNQGKKEGVGCFYQKSKGQFVLQHYTRYVDGRIWETVYCRNKKGERVVKKAILSLFKNHASSRKIYDDHIKRIEIVYKKDFYLIKKMYKTGNKEKTKSVKVKLKELDDKLRPYIIDNFDNLPFPFIIKIIDDLPNPPKE